MTVTRVEQFGGCGLKTTGWTVSEFGPQNPGAIIAGIGGGTCRHREMKLSHEGRVAIGSADL